MEGFFNQIYLIDLTEQRFEVQSIPDDVYTRFLGGKGLGTYLLLRETDIPPRDPFDPKNPVIFAIGPAAGLRIHGSSRYGVYTRSPQTGIYSESYSGGGVALAMASGGADAFVLKGVAAEPVFLEITDQSVIFHKAGSLWGMDIYTAEEQMKERVGDSRAECVVIGPAGENQIRFSTIASGKWRAAGRTGVGAVMGSKGIKGIVFHGSAKKTAADPGRLKQVWQRMLKKAKGNPLVKAYQTQGTPMLVGIMNTIGGFPTKYWSQGSLPGWENISAEGIQQFCTTRSHACPYCFMACGKLTTVKDGPHKGLTILGPEYETIYAFGGLCMIDDIGEIIYLNDLCDRLGIDTVTAGNLAAFTIEASQRKAIPETYHYGNAQEVAEIIEKIARKEGVGALLSQGIRKVSKAWGLQDIAVHVKGLEPAGYEPRVLKGMGLAYATSDRGACHMRSSFYQAELTGKIAPEETEGKAKLFVEYEDFLTLFDTLILCRFYKDLMTWEDVSDIVYGITGMEVSKPKLREIATSVTDAARTFNIRSGVTKKSDKLPKRFFREALKGEKKNLTPAEMEKMLTEYYRLRGWDEGGVPPSMEGIS
jgi:aldehyde:ferredoxin oxidoreductase